MSYTYATFSAAFAALLEYDATDPLFVAMLPDAIIYAENRIWRELDLAAAIRRDSTSALTTNAREFTLPSATYGNFRAIKGVNVITPAGTAASTGKRNPLVPVSRDVVDLLWPDADANTALPTQYAMLDNNTILVGPSPDAAYVVEVIGTVRPTMLSASNTTTYLSTYLPDLFLAGAMVFATGYKQNYGAQADDPKQAISWEAQYQGLKASAAEEESRRRNDSL